jgi:hypothetical protein
MTNRLFYLPVFAICIACANKSKDNNAALKPTEETEIALSKTAEIIDSICFKRVNTISVAKGRTQQLRENLVKLSHYVDSIEHVNNDLNLQLIAMSKKNKALLMISTSLQDEMDLLNEESNSKHPGEMAGRTIQENSDKNQ